MILGLHGKIHLIAQARGCGARNVGCVAEPAVGGWAAHGVPFMHVLFHEDCVLCRVYPTYVLAHNPPVQDYS